MRIAGNSQILVSLTNWVINLTGMKMKITSFNNKTLALLNEKKANSSTIDIFFVYWNADIII